MTQIPNDLPSPKIFISYRWTSPNHEDWVLALASTMRADGVDVVLDKWHLQEGQDTLAFMEQMVSDPLVTKVLLICDEAYVERANNRMGGVGTEAQIVSSKVYEKTDQKKFAAVVTELDADGRPYLPHYMATRLYFDMSSPDSESLNYDKILRWIYGKPFHALPPVGEPPKFLDITYASGAPTVGRAKIKRSRGGDAKNTSSGALEILDMISSDAPSFIRNLVEEDDKEDKCFEGMKATFPVLENLYSALTELIRVGDPKTIDSLHSFFEVLLALLDKTPTDQRFTRIDNDVVRFFAHDALISFVAIALQERAFKFAADLLSVPFFKPNIDQKTGTTVSYSSFRTYLDSLENRNKLKKLNRISLHADLLFERHEHSTVSFSYLLEADLILFVRGLIEPSYSWYPITSVYLQHTSDSLPSFARATSAVFYERLKPLLFDISPESLKRLIAESQEKMPRSGYWQISVNGLLNLEKLASLK